MRAMRGARWIAVAALLAVPTLASAGVVITDGKTSVTAATSTGSTSTVRVAVQTCTSTGCPVMNTGSGTTTTNTNVAQAGNTVTLTPYDLKQIQDGVVTSSEAQTGCSAGSSPAAALPLLLVGLVLLAARRRT